VKSELGHAETIEEYWRIKRFRTQFAESVFEIMIEKKEVERLVARIRVGVNEIGVSDEALY
jgi:hypothetical protein